MYIEIKKINETVEDVEYCFYKNIWQDTGEIDSRGFNIEKLKEVSGIVKFNKLTKDLEFDKENTDPYFFNSCFKEHIWVGAQILRFHDANNYPETYMIAKG